MLKEKKERKMNESGKKGVVVSPASHGGKRPPSRNERAAREDIWMQRKTHVRGEKNHVTQEKKMNKFLLQWCEKWKKWMNSFLFFFFRINIFYLHEEFEREEGGREGEERGQEKREERRWREVYISKKKISCLAWVKHVYVSKKQMERRSSKSHVRRE